MAQNGVRILLKEHLVDGHVHGGDHFLRVADELPVQVLIEHLDVPGIDAQVGLLEIVDLKEEINFRFRTKQVLL